MITFFKRIVAKFLWKPASQPHRFGSFTLEQLNQISYTKQERSESLPDPRPITPAPSPEQTERKAEEVGMEAAEAVEVEHEEKTEQEHALESAPVVLRPYKNPRIKLVPQGATLEPDTITKVRPDLNFERHAAILFAPAHSKNLHKPRSRTWVETLPDGKKITCSILVEPFRGKIPTTKTRKVYLALQKLLEEKGWNEEQNTVFSTRELAKALGLKWAGKKTTKELYEELDRLRGTLFYLETRFCCSRREYLYALRPSQHP